MNKHNKYYGSFKEQLNKIEVETFSQYSTVLCDWDHRRIFSRIIINNIWKASILTFKKKVPSQMSSYSGGVHVIIVTLMRWVVRLFITISNFNHIITTNKIIFSSAHSCSADYSRNCRNYLVCSLAKHSIPSTLLISY